MRALARYLVPALAVGLDTAAQYNVARTGVAASTSLAMGRTGVVDPSPRIEHSQAPQA